MPAISYIKEHIAHGWENSPASLTLGLSTIILHLIVVVKDLNLLYIIAMNSGSLCYLELTKETAICASAGEKTEYIRIIEK